MTEDDRQLMGDCADVLEFLDGGDSAGISTVQSIARGLGWHEDRARRAVRQLEVDEVLGPEGVGDETTRRPPAWGYRLGVSLYLEGEHEFAADDDFVQRVFEAVQREVPDARFGGVTFEPVTDEPKDQTA